MLPPLRAGELLHDRYKIIQPIGQGGMGRVYQAEDLRLTGRLCAIKDVQEDPSLPAEMRQQAHDQFYREASTLARLDYPNLPKVSDFFAEGDRDYLVMDFVPGRDLKTILDEARQNGEFLPEADVLRWALQLADALMYLHQQEPPIIHRDIKPSNVRLTPNGLLKLVDFGLVKMVAPDERTVTVVQGLGSAHYIPLEQYGDDSGGTDARTDIYSLGATLYHLLTNEPPPEAKQRFLRPNSLKPPRSLNPALSTRTERALLWAMALHPDDRPPDVATWREVLTASREALPEYDGETVVVRPVIRLPRFYAPLDRALMAAAGGLLLLAALLTQLR
jgi:eukaryotic-like serine/threonine-protein kinase